jgi:uncharacterized protein
MTNDPTETATSAVLEALGQMYKADAEQLALAMSLYNEIAPALHARLAQFLETQELPDEDDSTLFWGVHLMAAARDQSAFPNMLRLLALHDDILFPLLGEATTITSGQLIAGTFNQDTAALIAFLEHPDTDPYIRWNGLETMAFLTFDKRIDPAETEKFLHRFYTARTVPPGDPGWYAWMIAAGLLGLTSLDEAVRAAFADELIDPSLCEVDSWDELVAAAQASPDDPTRFSDEAIGYITDIYESMGWVAWDDDADEEDVPPPIQPLRNPLRNVGRNDPCPCGSGKKYKKCCLPA